METYHVLVNVSKANGIGSYSYAVTPPQIFEACILSTYQSSHVQFLLFQLSSHDVVSSWTHTYIHVINIIPCLLSGTSTSLS